MNEKSCPGWVGLFCCLCFLLMPFDSNAKGVGTECLTPKVRMFGSEDPSVCLRRFECLAPKIRMFASEDPNVCRKAEPEWLRAIRLLFLLLPESSKRLYLQPERNEVDRLRHLG